MHGWDEDSEALFKQIVEFVSFRMRMDPPPLDRTYSPAELMAQAGHTITPEGLGGTAALDVFANVLARANLSTDHPRSLAFIPNAPTEAASMFDLVVGASSIFGGSWLIGSGAVYAENQALRWIADLIGYPAGAGGVFSPGGTQGTLAALVTARELARNRRKAAGLAMPRRWILLTSSESHSSVRQVGDVMDVDTVTVDVAHSAIPGVLTGAQVAAALDQVDSADEVFAIVASGGTTNYGIVDDLTAIVDVAEPRQIWVHVDGAYGGAALAAPSVSWRFAGLDRCDSFIVDPHKWLFAPYDACALLYRHPEFARAALTQRAGYLDVLTESDEWNPADYAVHLSRRARGLPFWFSLATHGTDRYTAAVEHTLAVAAYAAAEIRIRPELELVREPQLSVVVLRRVGWDLPDYQDWSADLLASGTAFVAPTLHEGAPATRLAIVNPQTQRADIDVVLDSMR
ncbi:MAG: pyridoxal-dependent decarboxylase [Actinomycetes bacterium]